MRAALSLRLQRKTGASREGMRPSVVSLKRGLRVKPLRRRRTA
jgi:hypothetical protein